MPAPKDAYSAGYAEGKNSTAGGAFAEMTMGMLRDDPGGHFAAGYRDAAAGKEFKLPTGNVRRADAELNPFDDKAAIKTVCPNCREMDWFEWRFLGRLTDPVCGHSWYAGSGTYAGMQLRASFQLGRKFGKYMTSGKSKSSISSSEDLVMLPVKGMFWLMGALIGIGCRLEFGILMVPVQAVVGLLQPKQTNEQITARIIALAIVLGGLGIGFYELKHQSTPQFQSVSIAQPAPFLSVSQPQPNATPKPGFAPPLPPPPATLVGATQFVLLGDNPAGSSNWISQAQLGATQVTWHNPQPLEIIAQPNPQSNITLYSSRIFSGNVDASFVFDHQGFGRTSVGLWSAAKNEFAAVAILDTNDTNYLDFSAGGLSTEYKYSSTPYMNKWTTIELRVVGTTVFFLADGVQLESMPVITQGGLRAAVGAGSVSWKSGANDTSFRSITATGSQN